MTNHSLPSPRAALVATLLACTASLLAAPPTTTDASRGLRLVPFPRKVRLTGGTFALAGPLEARLPKASSQILAAQLGRECKLAGVAGPKVTVTDGDPLVARLLPAGVTPGPVPTPDKKLPPEGYLLEVRPKEVVCVGGDPAGLFYAIQTLRQLIRANRKDGGLPCLTIRDWPALKWRCFQDDLTRGPSSRLATMQRDVDLGAATKMNVWTYYMEYQYAFKKHPKIGPKNGSLTPADLKALVAYAQGQHVRVMGNQQSFGHMTHVLKHEEYADLREASYILSPTNEKTYALLDDLYSEVIPLLPFEFFNVCCDETWALGKGPSAALAKKIGVGGVYVQHIQRVRKLITDKYGKRMMMWGDIILQHPDKLDKIPKDVIMLTWGYSARPSFEHQIIPFAKSGYEFFVCPGVSNWSRILPDFGVATTNIRNFVRDGVKHGAIGMLNTAWEDDGEALNAPKWHGHAWAAECAWTGSATTPEDFNRRVGAVLFGEKGDRFGKAIELLGQAHRMPGMMGMNNRRFWKSEFPVRGDPKATRAQAERLLAVVQPAIEHLEACRKEAACNAELLEHFLQGARRMEMIAARMRDAVALAKLYADVCEGPKDKALASLAEAGKLVQATRDATQSLAKEFRRLWLAESKPYALDRTMGRYAAAVKRYDALLSQLAEARKAVNAGTAPPDASELGLGMPKPVIRLAKPTRVVATPLLDEAPWAEAKASHRVGLVVGAGKVDRHDLPVEVDLSLPAGVPVGPVRAFRVDGKGAPVEVPAQVDQLGKKGPTRLALVLGGKLAKGSTAQVHVYLGLKSKPAPLPGAVSTQDAPGGRKWLANDKARLLLGPEGAHVYRWEVKARKGRDVTMPGQAGWAGLSDMAQGYRSAPFALVCLARGPALVRYQCIAPDGMIKTISLQAGASWMDVLLSKPTGHYWDFDTPANFAADGPTPGKYLFSNGKTGPVGTEADGVPAQVKMPKVHWGMKYHADKLALGLVTPEAACSYRVAPGAGAGGVGIESSPPASHFVTFAGVLTQTPAETMRRLQQTLDLRHPPETVLHAVQKR